MRKFSRLLIFLFIFIDLILLFIILRQHVHFVIFDPAGLVAEKEKSLFVMISLLGLSVILSVIAVAFFVVWKYREDNTHKDATEIPDHKGFMLLWWIIPTIIVTFTSVITWKSTHELDPYKPLPTNTKPLRIQVISLQWKWLFIYPEQNIATVNYIVFPEKTPINFELTADSPMNSFWIPQLGGQMYSMSGMVTKTHLIASHTGEFQAQTAEISGTGFAGMKFIAKATTSENFDAWVKNIQRNSSPLGKNAYDVLARPSEDVKPVFFSSVQESLYNDIVSKYMPSSQANPANESWKPNMKMY